MKKVKSIRNLFGEEVNLNNLDIKFVGHNYVIACYKGYGFMKNFSPADGYTVEFEK